MNGRVNHGQTSHGDPGALSAAALRVLLEKVPVVVWATDLDLRVTSTAGAGLLPLGLRPGQGVGLTAYQYFRAEDDTHAAIAAHLGALRGEARDVEFQVDDRIFAARIEPFSPAGAPIQGALGVAVDVTDQRSAERELRQLSSALEESRNQQVSARFVNQRVSELGDVLSAILGAAERLRTPEIVEDRRQTIELLVQAAGRGASLIGELRDPGGRKAGERGVPSGPALDGRETILLVDDEPQVRGFVRRALEEYGYRVLESAAVEEALAMGASHPGRIHLLLTDVVLPGMSGPQLAARLAPLRPEMRILYMTGYADDAVVHRGVLAAGQALIVKPFTSLGLAHEVKKALRN